MQREKAWEILKKYNREPSHIRHALAVEATMRHFAQIFAEDPELWGAVGLVHDVDWEQTQAEPSRHCHRAVDLLTAEGVAPEIIRAVQSHGWGICSDIEPLSNLEKVLYAAEELTGLVIACGLVRPSRSLMDLEVKSVKKRWKDKTFAKGVNREVITMGAERLNIPLETLINGTIQALRPVEKDLGLGLCDE